MPTSRVKHSTTERVVLLCPCSYRYLEKWPSTHFWGSSFEPCYIENNAMLTYLRRMEFPTIINWTGPFPGLLGGIFHFYSNFKRAFCKQTVETQNVASDLGLHCLRTFHKKEARLIWLKPKKCEPNRWKYCRIINTWMMFRYAVSDLTLCISSGLLAISVLKP